MNNPLQNALTMADYLISTCGMALWDACRIAAQEYQLDTVQLYRIMTD